MKRPKAAAHRNSLHRPEPGFRRSVRLVALAVVFAWLTASVVPPGLAAAGAQPKPVHEVKAALVYRVSLFVQWPDDSFEDASSPIRIAVVGDDEMYEALRDIVQGKHISEHPIEVVRGGSGERYDKYHVVYLDSADSKSTESFIRSQEDVSTLTIGDSDEFCARGGMVRFLKTESSRIGLEVNVDAAGRAQLKISSKLLDLATIYHESD